MNQVLAFAVLTAAVLMAPVATAQSTGGQDRTAIQSVISRQIDAFRRDDGPSAYAAASPGIQSIFPNIEIFMSMVAGGYAPVYRPKSFAFGPLVETPAGPIQRLFVVGPDGVAYLADYLMERQPDGAWKVNGVSIVRDDQPSI